MLLLEKPSAWVIISALKTLKPQEMAVLRRMLDERTEEIQRHAFPSSKLCSILLARLESVLRLCHE